MTLLPLPPNALEELPHSECPQGVLMELLGSLQHPYIYPILDLGFFHTATHHYACLVMPFNPRGSLKDLIYKVCSRSETSVASLAKIFSPKLTYEYQAIFCAKTIQASIRWLYHYHLPRWKCRNVSDPKPQSRFTVAVERVMESKVHEKVDRSAHIASAKIGTSSTRSVAVPARPRNPIARASAQR